MNVVKHDGRVEKFSESKIRYAVAKASEAVGMESDMADFYGHKIANAVVATLGDKAEVMVDEIHDTVEKALMSSNAKVAKAYILYRQKRTDAREMLSPLARDIARFYGEINKDNANAANGSAASKMYSVAEAATKRYNLAKMSDKNAWYHRTGRIYQHDLGYYGVTVNCFFNPLAKQLRNGFENGVGSLRRPSKIWTASALACIILQSAQNSMFGGQGFLNFDTDLAPYVEQEFCRQCRLAIEVNPALIEDRDKLYGIAMRRTNEATYEAMEAFVANMNTMRSRSGAQVTFSSVNFGTDTSKWARMVSFNLFKAYEAGLGKGEQPIFPNLCYRLKDGVNLHDGEPNFDLTMEAIRCVGKRIQPRFVFCDSPAYDGLELEQIGTMGCRTAVRSNVNGDKNPDGRGNLAFSTINLPMIALDTLAKYGDENLISDFMHELDNTVAQAIDGLLERYEVVCQLKVRDLPFISDWYMGHEGLKPDDSIEPMIKNGSLSVGFCGLAECLVALTGKHHGESEEAQELGLKIVGAIRKATDKATKIFHLNFSCFATPAESACYTLLKAIRKEYGFINGVSDKEYLTNSCHIPVGYECDAKHKIDVEAPYHLLCNAGAIFYIEAGKSPKRNEKGLLSLLEYMDKSGVVYGGVNWTHARCADCNFGGDFEGDCPKCGSKNIKETKIITGYLSEVSRFNAGKVAEAHDRLSHT